MKLSLNQKLREILFIQDIAENKNVYTSIDPSITGGHIGIDISFGYMDSVYAPCDGIVTYISEDTIVIISEDYEIMLAHCSDVLVDKYESVKRGQPIAKQSFTGPSVMWKNETSEQDKIAWSHLHIGIRKILNVQPDRTKRFIWDYRINYDYDTSVGDKTRDYFIDPKEFSVPITELIANAIAKMEGNKENNPGNIKGLDGKFLKFNTYQEGFDYLCNYITRSCTGKHRAYNTNMSVYDFFKVYAPSYDNNDPLNYAKFVVDMIGLKSINDPISDWLLTELSYAKKYTYSQWIAYPELQDKNVGIIIKILKYIWNVIMKG